jgi:hypothetical protein
MDVRTIIVRLEQIMNYIDQLDSAYSPDDLLDYFGGILLASLIKEASEDK